MSTIDYAAIRARMNAATPGPWGFDTSGVWHCDSGGPILDKNELRKGDVVGIGMVGDSYPRGDNHPTENMEFIAHARTDVEALLDRCEALERDAIGTLLHQESPDPTDAPEWFRRLWRAEKRVKELEAAIDNASAIMSEHDDESPLAIGAVCREEACGRVLFDAPGYPRYCGDCDPQAEYRGSD